MDDIGGGAEIVTLHGGAGALDRSGGRLYASALSRVSKPGERRRRLICTNTEYSETAGGSRGKFLEPRAARAGDGRGRGLVDDARAPLGRLARRRRWAPVGLSVRPMIGPNATGREPPNRRSRVKVPTLSLSHFTGTGAPP